MVRDTVAHCLDKDGTAAVRERNAACFPHRLVHGEDVVAVDADRVDAVAHAATGDAVAAVLFQCRGGDGVAVVAADEDDGAGASGGDVQAGVKVAFACSALAEVAGYDSGRGVGVLEGLEFQGVGGAGGLGDLGCEWGGDGVLCMLCEMVINDKLGGGCLQCGDSWSRSEPAYCGLCRCRCGWRTVGP